MEGRRHSFASSHHPFDDALAFHGGSSLPSPFSHPRESGGRVASVACESGEAYLAALGASTYVAGEDAGRLARVAREFGLTRTRPPRRQLRKHACTVNIRSLADIWKSSDGISDFIRFVF